VSFYPTDAPAGRHTLSKPSHPYSHYAILSVEKCSGPNNTEEIVWRNARLVKSKNPAVRMVFYWATDQGALGCYGDAVQRPLLNNPSWWLKDDAGDTIYANRNTPMMD
jgi:hypothetical protein